MRLAPLEEQGVLADQVRERDEIVSREFSAAMDKASPRNIWPD